MGDGGTMGYVPLKMSPCYKRYLWGGTRLKKEFGKADAPDITAESWEFSNCADGQSYVAEGPYAGKTVAELGCLDRDGFWGRECRTQNIPLLVKLIDAKEALSIQVHPSDGTALVEQGERGKAEMWYIIDCAPQAFIYYGFSKKITKEEFLRQAQDGSICEVLNRIPVARGDIFYIPPGTIHAIGGGIVFAEIQQNSNTTFRIYDYQRKNADGTLRTLHLERAAEVLNYNAVVPQDCKANNSVRFPEFTMAEMFSCRYFRAFRIDVRISAALLCDGQSFQHVLCVEGGGHIRAGSKTYPFGRGDSFFMPAALGEYEIVGRCRVLLSRMQEGWNEKGGAYYGRGQRGAVLA